MPLQFDRSQLACIRFVEGRPARTVCEDCSGPKNLAFGSKWFMTIFKEITENECVNESHPPPLSGAVNWHNTARYWVSVARRYVTLPVSTIWSAYGEHSKRIYLVTDSCSAEWQCFSCAVYKFACLLTYTGFRLLSTNNLERDNARWRALSPRMLSFLLVALSYNYDYHVSVK